MSVYRHIMVPIDGSKESHQAFKNAVSLAYNLDASLLLVHVVDTRQYQNVIAYDPIMAKEAYEEAHHMLNEYVKVAHEQGVDRIEMEIKYGSPKEEISYQLPKEYDIDLIVIGATGLNAFERLVLGSVSEYVTRHAPCDVTVVRCRQS